MEDFRALGKRLRNWGRWGADDQRGTLNFITPERLVAAAGLVKKGSVFSLGIPFDAAGPQPGGGRINPVHLMSQTGDAQVFARTAIFNMNTAGFYTKWLKDIAADQFDNGSVPYVIPDVLSGRNRSAGAAGWADAAVIIPWTMYLTYGDKRVLAEQYDSMAKWVEYMRGRAGDDYIWDGDYHFGDWLAFATNRPDYPGATTSKDFIATAFYAHSTDLLRQIAHLIGKERQHALCQCW